MYKEITLLWNPMSTQHIYGQSGRIRYMKADAKKLKADYIRQATEQWWDDEIIATPVSIVVKMYFWDKRKRDRDNYHKIAIDSLVGIVMVDDELIESASVQKWYDKEHPRYEIAIFYHSDDPKHRIHI